MTKKILIERLEIAITDSHAAACADIPIEQCKDCDEAQHALEGLEDVYVALAEIKSEQGRVCEGFGLCRHAACASSYASWQIAATALAPINEGL